MMSTSVCSCIKNIQSTCNLNSHIHDEYTLMNDPEFGRMVYTCAILLMFAFVIVLLMFRSIKRNSSTVEVGGNMEALLDAMRFREELDIQQRQRRRLMKAKTKVTAWLTKTHGAAGVSKGWRSSPQLIAPRKPTISTLPKDVPTITVGFYSTSVGKKKSTTSDIPEIVITDEPADMICRSRTPALSLIYDFDNGQDTVSILSSGSAVGNRVSPYASNGSLHRDSFSSQRNSVSLDIDPAPRLSICSQSMSFD